jgi:broad specificity phosphatase PhoE
MRTKIYLVRHGQTDWNKDRRVQGWTDIKLNKEGVKEAKKIGEYFKDKVIHAIYSSPLKRALQTAKEIARHKKYSIHKVDEFREGRFGIFEGVRYEDVVKHKDFREGLEKQGHFHYRPPQGESYGDIYERVSEKLDKIVEGHRDEQILIVTHGGVVRSIAHKIGLITHDLVREIHIPNAKPFVFQYDHKQEDYKPIDFTIEYINK